MPLFGETLSESDYVKRSHAGKTNEAGEPARQFEAATDRAGMKMARAPACTATTRAIGGTAIQGCAVAGQATASVAGV